MTEVNLESELNKCLETNIPLVFLEGFETQIQQWIKKVEKNNFKDRCYQFSFINGLEPNDSFLENQYSTLEDLIEGLVKITNESINKNKNLLLVIHGLEVAFQNESSEFIDLLKRISILTKNEEASNLTIVFSGFEYNIPSLLREHSILLVNSIPKINEIRKIINDFIDYNIGEKEQEVFNIKIDISSWIENFIGLSQIEIEQILGFSFYEYGIELFTGDIYKEKLIYEIKEFKKQKLNKLGTLEFVQSNLNLDKDIAGLEGLIEYILEKKRTIQNYKKLKHYNIDLPKGILLLGEPGTGKSLSAQAIANTLELELIKFDISQILGKYVGESEKRMRETLNVIQFMSPCVLWIDEIEKAFAGVNKDNNEVMRKIFGQLLTWMSDTNEGVYVIATANNVEGILPPEFLRKGRFDDIFYIDRPNKMERKKIIELHFKKRNVDVKDYGKKIEELADLSDTLVGADLEYCCNEFAINYHTSSGDINKVMKEQFERMNTQIEKIKKSNIKKGMYNSYQQEFENLNQLFKDELVIAEKGLADGNKGLLKDEIKKIMIQNVDRKISDIIQSVIAKKNNKVSYTLATKESNEE